MTDAPLPVEVPRTDADNHQYLTLSVGGESFAIGILHVKEIMGYGVVTEVPMMPAFIRGVINLRGSVVPVIDLAARFGQAPSAIAKRTSIVIIEVSHGGISLDIGIVVDAVHAVLEIREGNIKPPPSFGARVRPDFIQGMGDVDDRFIVILDVTKVLSVEEMSSLATPGVSAG